MARHARAVTTRLLLVLARVTSGEEQAAEDLHAVKHSIEAEADLGNVSFRDTCFTHHCAWF